MKNEADDQDFFTEIEEVVDDNLNEEDSDNDSEAKDFTDIDQIIEKKKNPSFKKVHFNENFISENPSSSCTEESIKPLVTLPPSMKHIDIFNKYHVIDLVIFFVLVLILNSPLLLSWLKDHVQSLFNDKGLFSWSGTFTITCISTLLFAILKMLSSLIT